jgi:multimeric flavodoxin WrbA
LRVADETSLKDGQGIRMSKIAIVVGHARNGTLCEALGEAYARGAKAGGHLVTLVVTSRMSFDPILHEGFARVQPLEPDLTVAHDAMLAADHLVFIFPLWLGTFPAIFKGFLERVLQPDLVEPARQGREAPQGKIGPRHHDHGHAGLRVPLVFRRARPEGAQAQHLSVCRRLSGALHDLWLG